MLNNKCMEISKYTVHIIFYTKVVDLITYLCVMITTTLFLSSLAVAFAVKNFFNDFIGHLT